MSNLLLIWGAGGHGKVVLDVARSTGRFARMFFIDDDAGREGTSFCGCTVLAGADALQRFPHSAFVVAIGDNRMRARCFQRACERGLQPAAVIHSSAVIAGSATIAVGTVVMPGTIVNAGAVIGENCIINSGAIIEHDCRIERHVHISPRVVLGGGVSVGALAHVGIGAVVLPGASLGEESLVGAGAVVLKSAPARSTVVGVPARNVRQNQ